MCYFYSIGKSHIPQDVADRLRELEKIITAGENVPLNPRVMPEGLPDDIKHILDRLTPKRLSNLTGLPKEIFYIGKYTNKLSEKRIEAIRQAVYPVFPEFDNREKEKERI